MYPHSQTLQELQMLSPGRHRQSLTATLEFWHKEWLLKLENKEINIVRSGAGVSRSKAVWNFFENSSVFVEQGFPYQASIRVKDEEGAEDQAEEEVDQVDVGGGAPHVDQHLYDDKCKCKCKCKCKQHLDDDKCKLVKLSPRRGSLVTLTLAQECSTRH